MTSHIRVGYARVIGTLVVLTLYYEVLTWKTGIKFNNKNESFCFSSVDNNRVVIFSAPLKIITSSK
jgi:hypothetical protein